MNIYDHPWQLSLGPGLPLAVVFNFKFRLGGVKVKPNATGSLRASAECGVQLQLGLGA